MHEETSPFARPRVVSEHCRKEPEPLANCTADLLDRATGDAKDTAVVAESRRRDQMIRAPDDRALRHARDEGEREYVIVIAETLYVAISRARETAENIMEFGRLAQKFGWEAGTRIPMPSSPSLSSVNRHKCVEVRLHRIRIDCRAGQQRVAFRPVDFEVARFDGRQL